MGMRRRRADGTVALQRRDEDFYTTQVHVDPSRCAHDLAAEDVPQPGRRGFRIGAAQMDVIPSDDRHFISSRRVMAWMQHVSPPARWPPLCDLPVIRSPAGTIVRLTG